MRTQKDIDDEWIMVDKLNKNLEQSRKELEGYIIEYKNKILNEPQRLIAYHEWYLKNRDLVSNSGPKCMVDFYLRQLKKG